MKWLSRLFTGIAILGWLVMLIIIIDAMIYNCKLITGALFK
jgi:hypothetical protein